MEELFAKAPFRLGDPGVEETDAGLVETRTYRVTPRPTSKFKTLLDAHELFGGGGVHSTIVTTLSADGATETLDVKHQLAGTVLYEHLACSIQGGRLKAQYLRRDVGEGDGLSRTEQVHFDRGPIRLPAATYPEVMLPFVMRGQPLDGRRRAAYSWTNDRFCARIYYEVRKKVSLQVPAGRFEAALVWMYPDLNDWIALGNMVTRLVKPFLPRYDIWFEAAPPYRVLRFEGPYGPPAAPEIVLELAQ